MTELVVIAGDGSDPPFETRRRARRCVHRRFWLDADVRRAFCKDCEQEVPLWDVLAHFARDHERYVHARDRAKREAQQAQRDLDNVKRDLRNARGRLRRADAA